MGYFSGVPYFRQLPLQQGSLERLSYTSPYNGRLFRARYGLEFGGSPTERLSHAPLATRMGAGGGTGSGCGGLYIYIYTYTLSKGLYS